MLGFLLALEAKTLTVRDKRKGARRLVTYGTYAIVMLFGLYMIIPTLGPTTMCPTVSPGRPRRPAMSPQGSDPRAVAQQPQAVEADDDGEAFMAQDARPLAPA